MFAGCVDFQNGLKRRPKDSDLARAFGAVCGRGDIQKTARAEFIQVGSAAALAGGPLFVSSSRLDACPYQDRGPSEAEGPYIKDAFERLGDAGIATLLGAFAFAHWDERAGTLTLVRDYFGRCSLFYYASDNFVAFASHLGVLLAMPEVPRILDEAGVANVLALNLLEREQTIYRGIRRVPSRTILQIRQGGVEQRHYWSPKPAAPLKREADYIARGRDLLDQAVARALRGTTKASVYLSGGLDSSAVAATAARLNIAQIDTYTGVPPPDLDRPARAGCYLDESDKVAALGRLYPSLNMHFITPRGAHLRQSDPARFFPYCPLPMMGIANLGWFEQIGDALSGTNHPVILTGGMGNLTLSWDGAFSLSHLLAEGRLIALCREAWELSQSSGTGLLRVLAREAVLPHLPVPLQRAILRARGIDPDDVSRFSLLHPDAIKALGLQRQWREQGFNPSFGVRRHASALRAVAIFDSRQPGRDHVQMGRAMAGFDMRDPLADRDLVEFCLSVPETLYRRHGVRRWFARQVLADRLPPEILHETKRGEQAPNWFESLNARKAVVDEEVERLAASPLASRLIDLPRLKDLLAHWPKDAREAQRRENDYRFALDQAVHIGKFIRWVEGGNG